jgi:hypothetical protein
MPSAGDTAAASSPAPPRGAFVYLTQVRHSSYGRDSLGMLRGSLSSLVEHYLKNHRDDVLLLHTGDFDAPRLQASVLDAFAEDKLPIRFVRLDEARYFSLPSWLNATARSERSVAQKANFPKALRPEHWKQYPYFSVGYRNMIRFFTTRLWDFAHELGYDWVARMDEESRLLLTPPELERWSACIITRLLLTRVRVPAATAHPFERTSSPASRGATSSTPTARSPSNRVPPGSTSSNSCARIFSRLIGSQSGFSTAASVRKMLPILPMPFPTAP